MTAAGVALADVGDTGNSPGLSLRQLSKRLDAEAAKRDPRPGWQQELDAAETKLAQLRHLRDYVFADPEYAAEVAEEALWRGVEAGVLVIEEIVSRDERAAYMSEREMQLADQRDAALYYDNLIAEHESRVTVAQRRAVVPAPKPKLVVVVQGRARARAPRRRRRGGTRASPERPDDPDPAVAGLEAAA